MIRAMIVVREPGKLKPDYSLPFDLPELPSVGDYISIHRPDKREPYGEDLVVRKVWWRLKHPETSGFLRGPEKVGSVHEIFVECDPAIGPYSSDQWRSGLEHADTFGIVVERFDVERYYIPESELEKMEKNTE